MDTKMDRIEGNEDSIFFSPATKYGNIWKLKESQF